MDVDILVTSFWKTVFEETDWLCDQVRKIPVTLRNWHFFKQDRPRTNRERALKCLFLNRTSFSGILADDAGPIGGQAQESEYTIDCRFPRQRLCDRIRKIAYYRNRVEFVWRCDWEDGFFRLGNGLSKKFDSEAILLYCDPPFFAKADRLYRYYFENEDHLALRDALYDVPLRWILSYDDIGRVRILYRKTPAVVKRVSTFHTAASNGSRKVIKEALVTNF